MENNEMYLVGSRRMSLYNTQLIAAMYDSFWGDINAELYGDYQLEDENIDMGNLLEQHIENCVSMAECRKSYAQLFRAAVRQGAKFATIFTTLDDIANEYNATIREKPELIDSNEYTVVKSIHTISCNIFNIAVANWLDKVYDTKSPIEVRAQALMYVVKMYTGMQLSMEELKNFIHTPIVVLNDRPMISHIRINGMRDLFIVRPDLIDETLDDETADKLYDIVDMFDVVIRFMLTMYGDIAKGGHIMPVMTNMFAYNFYDELDREDIVDYLLIGMEPVLNLQDRDDEESEEVDD